MCRMANQGAKVETDKPLNRLLQLAQMNNNFLDQDSSNANEVYFEKKQQDLLVGKVQELRKIKLMIIPRSI